MKLLKTFTAAALLVLGTTVMAQGPGQGQGQGNRQMRSSSERAKMETEQLTESLGLSTEQKVKVLEINMKYAAKDSVRFAGMRAQGQNIDRDVMMKEMQAQRAEQAKEVKALLTDDQKTKYDAYLKEKAERGPRGGQGGQRPESGN
jgi:periplasmic protein CpxP/Spy